MKCQICSKLMFSRIKCNICNNIFCSSCCLETHIFIEHKSLVKNKIYEKPKIERIINGKNSNSYSLLSPYITDGYISDEIKYESIYNLNNFTPVLEYNNPKIIGIGSYGKVYLYRNIMNNKLYAIKHLNKMILCKSIHTIKRIYDEINIQSRIYHQNIVRLLNVKENDDSIYLIMEYAINGSLFNYIRKKKFLTEEESFRFFSQIINAIYFLHKNDFIHRDIKPENILIFDNGICKLCDFGCCVELNGKQRSTFCGTTEYMSPEIVNKKQYSKEIDIWSLGILLYEMIHGYSPFKPNKENFNAKEVIDKIKLDDINFNIIISKECKELICHLLDKDAKNRYKIEDIFKSNFFKKYERMNFYFLNEKYPVNNFKKDVKYNYTERKCFDNPLLLSSLIENDNIISKTLFNNIKYKDTKKSNVKNKINNVIFNNSLNRNPNNIKMKNDKMINRQLMTSREFTRKINLPSDNNSMIALNENYENFNSGRPKNNVKVKVTKLSSTSFNLPTEFSFLNDSIKNVTNKCKQKISNKNHPPLKKEKSRNNKLIEYNSFKDINSIKNKHNENELNSDYMENFPKSKEKKKLIEEDNNVYKYENEPLKIKGFTDIKNNYYNKPKIEKISMYPKDDSKNEEKQKSNIIHYKNCLNTKIKIPRRKILNSLQLENINILNNIDLIDNNDITSLNTSNQLSKDDNQINVIPNDFIFINSFQNNSYRTKNNDRYEPYLNNNSINTQINKNYIFNPKISINLPKYSFSTRKINNNKKNVKIKEISEDFKDKIVPKMDLSKSQIFEKRKIINNVKKISTNKLFAVKKDIFALKNNIYEIENNEIPRVMSKSKKQKVKLNNSLQLEQIYQPQNKYGIKNISKTKKIENSKRILCSKTVSNSLEKLKEPNNNNKEELGKKLENKKFNVKQKDKNEHMNLILIKYNKLEQNKKRNNNNNANNNCIKPISDGAKIKITQ